MTQTPQAASFQPIRVRGKGVRGKGHASLIAKDPSQRTISSYFSVSPVLNVSTEELIQVIPSDKISKNLIRELVTTVDENEVERPAKRRKYNHLKKEEQLEIVHYAINDQGQNFRSVCEKFSHIPLKRSTFSDWLITYNELHEKYINLQFSPDEARLKADEEFLLFKSLGRPSILPPNLATQHFNLIKGIKDSGGTINCNVIISLAQAIVKSSSVEGTHFTEAWARSLMRRNNWVLRKSTTDRGMSKEELITAATLMENIRDSFQYYHPDLVLEMDETLAPWSFASNFSFAPCGSKRVTIIGKKDKRGSTVTLTITLSSKLLPPQTIWSGITKSSIPPHKQPPSFLNCFAGQTSEKSTKNGVVKRTNQWQNRKTMSEYLRFILKPYLDITRKNLDFSNVLKKDRALFIMDHHWSHLTPEVKEALEALNVDLVFIPKKATDYFSVLDVSINKPFKAQLKKLYNSHMSVTISKLLTNGATPESINVHLKSSEAKPLLAEWIKKAWTYLDENPQFIENGWKSVNENVLKFISNQNVTTNGK